MTYNKFLFGLVITAIVLSCVPASAASAYTLGIFGNANEDDTIDQKDVEYTASVVLGLDDKTQFADAKYDGEIDILDVTQIELIMLRQEKELTLIDQADRIVTVSRPIERVVTTFPSVTRAIFVVDGPDRLVGVSNVLTKYSDKMLCLQAYPEFKELPTVGMHTEPNAESILALKPDVVFSWSSTASVLQEKTGIPVITLTTPSYFDEGSWDSYKLAGSILGKEEEVEELISYANEKIEEITEITSEIPEDEKPKVYFVSCCQGICDITKTWGHYAPGDIAGGINVAEDQVLSSGSSIVSKEQIIGWNPDIVLLHGGSKTDGWDLSIEDILADPDLQMINAVKNKRVYYTKGYMIGWDPATGLTESFYMAKLFHPDKFEDLDVEEKNNEILKKFYGADGLYTWLLENYDFQQWE
ncbi:MAG: ABC transporter substrate-binding protein [Methanosarcinaceae archaeon]|nr:ABC transporter substrate-binding protein [Methanosarcinaceae archaeon]